MFNTPELPKAKEVVEIALYLSPLEPDVPLDPEVPLEPDTPDAVSYTHLTLPTICSV